jgi:hypothetical protein
VSSSTDKVVATIPIPGGFAFAIDPLNHDVYIAGSTIYVVSPETNAIVAKFSTGGAGGSAIYDPARGTMYVSVASVPGYVDVVSS